MVKSYKRTILAACIFIGVIALIFAVRALKEIINCSLNDQTACRFISKLSSPVYANMTGTVTGFVDGAATYTLVWKLQDGNQEIQYGNDAAVQMHAMMMDDYLYLKDYSDNRWWKQKRETAKQYQTHFVFEPVVFFENLKQSLADPEKSFLFLQEEQCADETCRKYSLRTPDQTGRTTYLFINKQSLLRKVRTEEEGTLQEILIEYTVADIVPPTENIKTATSEENIFLQDVIEHTGPPEVQTPEYVIQFEKTRQDAEKNGLLPGAPEYVGTAPSFTISL